MKPVPHDVYLAQCARVAAQVHDRRAELSDVMATMAEEALERKRHLATLRQQKRRRAVEDIEIETGQRDPITRRKLVSV